MLKGLLAWLPRKNAKPYFGTKYYSGEYVYLNVRTNEFKVCPKWVMRFERPTYGQQKRFINLGEL